MLITAASFDHFTKVADSFGLVPVSVNTPGRENLRSVPPCIELIEYILSTIVEGSSTRDVSPSYLLIN